MSDDNSLANRYRPKTIDEVVGQDEVVAEIKGMFKRNQLSRTLLISGTRGNGKTTIARIIASLANGKSQVEKSLDIEEINSANERGIDDIRALVERLKFAPQSGKYRVIIADEMHMLTPQAFSVLLKPLEEPAKHVLWILVTNEPYKLPKTILDRCTHLQLNDVTPDALKPLLVRVCKAEKIFLPIKDKHNKKIISSIAQISGGNPRQALTFLQKAANIKAGNSDINLKTLIGALEGANDKVAVILTAMVYQNESKNISTAMKHIATIKDYQNLVRTLMELNNYLIEKNSGAWSWFSATRKMLDKVMSERNIEFDFKISVQYQTRLVDLRQKLMYSGVDERALIFATFGQQLIGMKQ